MITSIVSIAAISFVYFSDKWIYTYRWMDVDMDMYMHESEIMIPFPPVLNPYLLSAYPSKLYAHHSFGFGAVPSIMSTETHRAIAEGVFYEIKNSFENPIYLFSYLSYFVQMY